MPDFEPDTPPSFNTFRRALWLTTQAIAYARAYWGRRFFGGAMSLLADAFAEGASQALYARLPGHSQQAADSLTQVAADRDLYRFRGETDANWLTRVREAWDDYEQGGTRQQVLKVINQWGSAGWPVTWNPANLTMTESGTPSVFSFTVTIAFGNISPPWIPGLYGGGRLYGESGFYYGLYASTDLAMLVHLVRKWKPSRSIGLIKIYYNATDSVTITA